MLDNKNKELELKLSNQHHEFTQQINELKELKDSKDSSKNIAKVSAFKQQLLDIKNQTLHKEKDNKGTEMTRRSTTRKTRKIGSLEENTLSNENDYNEIIPSVEVKDIKILTETNIVNAKMAVLKSNRRKENDRD